MLARRGFFAESNGLMPDLEFATGHTRFILNSRSHWVSLVCSGNDLWELHDNGQVLVGIPNDVVMRWANAFNARENHYVYSLHQGEKVPLWKPTPHQCCQVWQGIAAVPVQ